MSVPASVFVTAGYGAGDAAKLKKSFDEQEIMLAHLATGEITQVQRFAPRCPLYISAPATGAADAPKPPLVPLRRPPCRRYGGGGFGKAHRVPVT